VHDLAAEKPDIVAELSADYQAWAERCGVMDWNRLNELRRQRREEQGK